MGSEDVDEPPHDHALVSVVLVRGSHSTGSLLEQVPSAQLAAYRSVSNTRVASAVAWSEVRVGIDLEVARPRVHLDRLALRTMTNDEHRRWFDSERRSDAFAQHWTRVEAYLKAIGVGVKGGYLTRPGVGWSVIDLDLDAPLVGSLALEAEVPVVSLRWLTVPGTSR